MGNRSWARAVGWDRCERNDPMWNLGCVALALAPALALATHLPDSVATSSDCLLECPLREALALAMATAWALALGCLRLAMDGGRPGWVGTARDDEGGGPTPILCSMVKRRGYGAQLERR